MNDKLFINGEWVESNSQETIAVENPATEEVIARVPAANGADIDAAVQAAREAFPLWNALDVSERATYLEKILKGLEQNKDRIADTIVKELGTSRRFAEDSHVEQSPREMKATLEELDKFDFEEEIDGTKVIKEGFGVVACITPWNYPLNQIQRKITPALLAGNTVVVKPASLTPLTAMIYTEIIEEADLPDGVFNLVTGSGSTAGDYLAGHPDVDVISFTGSTEVGKGLYEKASSTVKKLVLELGGKSPMIYLKGGDLETAVKQAANTVINNQGQTCSALTRLIVPEDELDTVKAALKEHYKNVTVGDPEDRDTDVGPLVSRDQKEQVLEYIGIGKSEGAEILIGGHDIDAEGYYVEPTVFVNVTNDMTIAREEIFGPVLTVLTYETVEEAIEIANDSPYGLSGAVVGPQDEAERVARQLRTGNIYVNKGPRNPKAPFGGYKQSGFGRENGLYGLQDYLEIKSIFI